MKPERETAIDILVARSDPAVMRPLEQGLANAGAKVDTIDDLAELHEAFFRAGGHQAVVFDPSLPPSRVEAAIDSLMQLDERLKIIVFDNLGLKHPAHVTRLQDRHPGTRGTLMAVLRSLDLLNGS